MRVPPPEIEKGSRHH